ncbi:leptin receptor isoform X1 [Kryptolebias marmoratus]|nr:leptin receptor isoform X1 [Kryptolebias marmoratus]XP_017276078.1 leptin receptor isoform X1 [Kryptolebias marmoratus]
MITTLVVRVMLSVLMYAFLITHGAWCLEPLPGASPGPGILDLPWQDELCCDSPPASISAEGGNTIAPETKSSKLNLLHPSRCNFRNITIESQPQRPSGSICLDILCRIGENWENVACDLKPHGPPFGKLDAGRLAISFQQLPQNNNTEGKNSTSDNLVVCDAENSLTCSFHLASPRSFVMMVTVNISSAAAPPVLLRIPAQPVKPSPPFNLSHIQTIEGELILSWEDSLDFDADLLRYEVRYSSNTEPSDWLVMSAVGKSNVSLVLNSTVDYRIQARCASLDEPPLWSEWSETYCIFLDTVSYIPEKVVARSGENVTVYCVFNDHSSNASTAVWFLNDTHPINRNQYHPVSQWVSQVTVRASDTGIYDLLKCTKEWTLPYSQIFVEGGFIDISCVTNGDIDAMDCRWKKEEWNKLHFKYKWADLQCDVMEEKENAGENVGTMGPACMQVVSKQRACTIHPLRMNCYKLWLEDSSHLVPVRSKPVYLSPIDHIKPHTPTNVRAVSQSGGVLKVTWEPPSLPIAGLQCQLRYHSLSVIEKWKVLSPVLVPQAEVTVPNMCQVYVVQVRCMHISGTGYWSEWSDSVNSTTQNIRAPDRGPDFWRICEDDLYRNTSKITLLFEHFPAFRNSYCVDGFIVQHRTWNGSVLRTQIDLVSSYSFEWNQELQTVSVEAYNNVGSSSSNTNMTLEKQPKRRCVRSFHVSLVNSTCVSLSWSLLDISSVPLFMVVHWSPTSQQDSEDFGLRGQTWARLPYTEHPNYLRGDFYSSEEYGFYLYPVFADGEGEPMFTLATRGDPSAYMLLMFISFLCIVVFVTLVLSQNQVKKIVWKDVPNPNKCSWAKGLDFKTVDTFEHLFHPPEGLRALPLPSDDISTVIIVDKALTKALIQTPRPLTPDPAAASDSSFLPWFDPNVDQSVERETLLNGSPSLTITLNALPTSTQKADESHPVDPIVVQNPGDTNSSAQSSVTYSKVLLSEKQDQQPVDLHFRDGSRSSSSDEGNFSANNSDISESVAGGLWELDSCHGAEVDDPRRSCSYNSVEELSETSEPEDEGAAGQEKPLCYLEIKYSAEDEESEKEEDQREEETKTELLQNVVLNREDSCVELHPLLSPEDSNQSDQLLSAQSCGFSLLYLPQYRTAACTRQFQTQDGKP